MKLQIECFDAEQLGWVKGPFWIRGSGGQEFWAGSAEEAAEYIKTELEVFLKKLDELYSIG